MKIGRWIRPNQARARALALAASLGIALTAPGMAEAAPPEQEKYQAIDKTLYVWNPGASVPWWGWSEKQSAERLVGFCKTHGFRRAILFIGSVEWDWEGSFAVGHLPNEGEFVALNEALRKAGIAPVAAFYLNDAPSNLSNGERAADVVGAVAAFNQSHPASAWLGLDGDQEPGSPGPEYLSMNQGMLARKSALGATFAIGAALRPKWLNAPSIKDLPSAFSDALDSLDEGLLMAYQNTKEASKSMGVKGLGFADQLGKPLYVAIETADLGGGNEDSFYAMASAADKAPFFQMIVDLDSDYSTTARYAGFAVHDYAHYFMDLYGVSPDAYPGTTLGALYEGGPSIAPRSWPPLADGDPGPTGSGGASSSGAGGASGSGSMSAGAGGASSSGSTGSGGQDKGGSGDGPSDGCSYTPSPDGPSTASTGALSAGFLALLGALQKIRNVRRAARRKA